jgi:hypothetical protein
MKNVVVCVLFSLAYWLGGCGSVGCKEGMIARYTAEPVTVDGRLDDAAWQQAAVYRMHLSRDRQAEGQVLRDGGSVQVAWDDNNFYLGVHFTDSDITATGEKDQLHHYLLGDVCELFLKPENQKNYLELYVTPHGKKTSFFIPRVNETRNGPVDLDEGYQCGLKVAARVVKGTLNQRDDRDGSWTAEMAMPVADMEKLGEKVAAGAAWRILVSRYNYSHLFGPADDQIEFSMTPALSLTSYHLVDEYARLYLLK